MRRWRRLENDTLLLTGRRHRLIWMGLTRMQSTCCLATCQANQPSNIRLERTGYASRSAVDGGYYRPSKDDPPLRGIRYATDSSKNVHLVAHGTIELLHDQWSRSIRSL